MNIQWDSVAAVLRTAEKVVDASASIVTGASPVAGAVVATVGAAVGLAADLIDRGMHPVEAITRIRSSVPDFDAVTQELENYAAGKR